MNIALTAVGIVLAAIFLALASCASNKQIRTSFKPFDPKSPDHTQAVIESAADYQLGFVEFDDQGWFWDLNQKKTVEQMIQAEAGIDSANPSGKEGVVLVAFVHGWKDNAEYDSDGMVMFRQILTQLSEAEKAQQGRPARKVVGVYAAWRGLSATIEPFKELTFWERKNTAHKVGGYGAMTELLVDLENIQEASNNSPRATTSRTELIIIGHSFGGAAVYSALAQIITERFVDTVQKGQPLKPLGDQIILLNPAFEALRHYDLNQLAISIQTYPQDQRPVLSIFTSQGDWATHYFFPIGRFFSTLFESNRDHDQRMANLDTVGWFQPFITHNLKYETKPAAQSPGVSTFNAKTNKHELHNRAQLQLSINNIRQQRQKWHPNSGSPKTYNFDDTTLEPNPHFKPGDPFLIVSVDPKIMKDHSDIDNPVLINFLREYIQFCQIEPPAPSK